MAQSMGQGNSASSAGGASGDASGSSIGGVSISVGSSNRTNTPNYALYIAVGIVALFALKVLGGK